MEGYAMKGRHSRDLSPAPPFPLVKPSAAMLVLAHQLANIMKTQ